MTSDQVSDFSSSTKSTFFVNDTNAQHPTNINTACPEESLQVHNNRFLADDIDIYLQKNIEWTLVKEDTEQDAAIRLRLFTDSKEYEICAQMDAILNRYINRKLSNITGIEIIRRIFTQGMNKKDPHYLIRAYTAETGFFRRINQDLATVHYELSDDYDSWRGLHYFVSIIRSHPAFNSYNFVGVTYRGMYMTKKDLQRYTIGRKIMNKSFLSTSKDRSIAEFFVNSKDITRTSVLCTYTVQGYRSALLIEKLSLFESEKEVVIMPYCVFIVTNITQTGQYISIKLLESSTSRHPNQCGVGTSSLETFQKGTMQPNHQSNQSTAGTSTLKILQSLPNPPCQMITSDLLAHYHTCISERSSTHNISCIIQELTKRLHGKSICPSMQGVREMYKKCRKEFIKQDLALFQQVHARLHQLISTITDSDVLQITKVSNEVLMKMFVVNSYLEEYVQHHQKETVAAAASSVMSCVTPSSETIKEENSGLQEFTKVHENGETSRDCKDIKEVHTTSKDAMKLQQNPQDFKTKISAVSPQKAHSSTHQ